jgi:hypothetical protein
VLRVDRDSKTLSRLDQKRLPEVGLTERADIQQMIRNSPQAFFDEMGERLLLLGEEIRPADVVDDRIDLLALDQQGAAVVIELKRGAHKLHLLQALSYAAMVSNWEGDRLVEERQHIGGASRETTEEEIETFLLEDLDNLNATQRVVLLAEDFDYSVLVTAEWLTERYDVDVRCYRLALSADGGAEFLACTCIYPPPELTEHAARRGRGGTAKPAKWSNWEEALQGVENSAVVEFISRELERGRENVLGRRRYLAFRLDGKRRFSVQVRRKYAYVWQSGRFDDDEDFWAQRLGEGAKIQPVKDDRALRFYLATRNQFTAFSDALDGELKHIEFMSAEEPDEATVDT